MPPVFPFFKKKFEKWNLIAVVGLTFCLPVRLVPQLKIFYHDLIAENGYFYQLSLHRRFPENRVLPLVFQVQESVFFKKTLCFP